MYYDPALAAILVDRKKMGEFQTYIKNPPRELSLERAVTLDGFLKVLKGKSPLFSLSLLPMKVTGEDFTRFLSAVFSGSGLDPLSGTDPLFSADTAQGKRDKNRDKQTALRLGRFPFYARYSDCGFRNNCGGVTAWGALRNRFTQDKLSALRRVEQNLTCLIPEEQLQPQVLEGIHRVFCHVHPPAEDSTPPTLSPRLCRRQITMLLIECLLDEDVFTRQCRQWVETGQAAPTAADSSYDPLARYFGAGVFSLEKKDILPELLPDVEVGEERVYRYLGPGQTPLEQLLKDHPHHNLFLLHGSGDSGVSGAGKSTSLRKLCYDRREAPPVYVPLCQVYSAAALRTITPNSGQLRLLAWLELQEGGYTRLDELHNQFILMDGLDEMTDSAGAQAFCDDVRRLVENGHVSILICGKLPPEQLPLWNVFKSISTIWGQCLRARVRPMRPEQQRLLLPDPNDPLAPMLNTPFLLNMHQNVQRFLSQKHRGNGHALFSEWLRHAGTDISNAGALFYRYLLVQICRWFDIGKGNDAQNEADAFFLMYSLPAVAFHMHLNELYDPAHTPYVHPVTGQTAALLLDQSFPAFRACLSKVPTYTLSRRSVLADSKDLLGQSGLAKGQAGCIFPQTLNDETLEREHRFVTHALQENLAALHLSNLFFSARHNTLPVSDQPLPFYVCPAYFLPAPILRKAADLLDELAGHPGWTRSFLQEGPRPSDGDTPLSRYLLSELGGNFCSALGLNTQKEWREAAQQSYQQLEGLAPRAASPYRVNHIVNLCAVAQLHRLSGEYGQAAEIAREAIRFSAQHPDVKNSDGFHALSKIYLEQVTDLLNNREIIPPQVPVRELEFSMEIYQELSRLYGLCQQSGEVPCSSPLFGSLSSGDARLIIPLFHILDRAHLRLQAYGQENFFGSDTVRFLLTASFTAKAHSICAALTHASGAALNMLACFLENQQEVLENNPQLPFFRLHGGFHLDIDEEQLSYPHNLPSAFRVYHRIYRIKRGPQPYSARKLAQLLLSRRVRLNSSGHPCSGLDEEHPLTPAEHTFLQEATLRACSTQAPGYALPRLQYLGHQINALPEGEQRETLKRELHFRFREEWLRCNCREKLRPGSGQELDLTTARLLALCTPDLPIEKDPAAWDTRLCSFFRRKLAVPSLLRSDPELAERAALRYTTGTLITTEDYRRLWQELTALNAVFPSLRIHPDHGCSSRWQEIAEVLSK